MWTSHYDSVGFYDGAVGMTLVPKGNQCDLAGYSGNSFGSWDIVTVNFNAATGAKQTVNRVHNGLGAFISHPVSLATDTQSNVYVVGASEVSGPNVDIKIIKYDTAFNQVWVKTWGGTDSLDDEPTYMASDNNDNLIITGYTTQDSGRIDLLLLRYDKNGNLLWKRNYNNGTGSTHIAKGNSVSVGGDGHIYVTGRIYNGFNNDIVTLSYDTGGNLLWKKFYNAGPGSDDIGGNVSVDVSNNVYVSGTLKNATAIKYITIQYQQYKPTCLDTTSCANISYKFANGQITTVGSDTFVEFDIYAKQNITSHDFAAAYIYFTYSTSMFGHNIVDSGKITVTKGTITAASAYTLAVTDTLLKSDILPLNGGEVRLSITSSGPSSGLFAIADTFQQLCHIKIKRKKTGLFQIKFDKYFMQNQSQYYKGVRYANVFTGNGMAADSKDNITLTYTIGAPTYDGSTVKFQVFAKANYSQPIVDASILITYNRFALAPPSSAIPSPWMYNDYEGTTNPIYETDGNDFSAGRIYITAFAYETFMDPITGLTDNYDPNDINVHKFSTTTQENFLQVTMNVLDCSQNPELMFDFSNTILSTSNVYAENYVEKDYNILTSGSISTPFCTTNVPSITSDGSNIFSVSPNPFTNTFNLNIQLSENTSLNVDIIDMLGQVACSKSLGEFSAGTYSQQINVPHYLSSGFYYVRVRDNESRASTVKVIKQ